MAAAAPVAAAPAATAAAGATTDAAAAAPVVPQQRFKLEILATIKVAQQQNGLRHADYQRYRQYCSRRLQRVRKALGLLHPRKEPFKKKAIEAKHLTDAKVLSIPLLSAERAWAYAMQLKADMAEEKDNTRLKFHLLRRLTKAARHATELEQLCGTAGDARTQLEADAYRNWMHANVAFEKNNFADALQRFQHTKTVYEQMGKTVDRGTQLLCEERVAAIEPSIKYCKMVMAQRGAAGTAGAKAAGADAAALAASSNDAILRAKLESVLEDTRKAEAKNLERVSWQNAQWTVESEKLRVKFVEIKELVAKFQKKEEKGAADLKAATSPKGGAAAAAGDAKPPGGAAADAKGDESDSDNEGDSDNPNVLYVHLLSAYDEALNLIRDELKELKKGGDTAHSKEKETTLNALRNYTAFSKLKATGERNLIMAEHAARTYRVQIAEEERAKEAAAAAAALKAANKLSKKQKKAAAAAEAKASADAKDAKTGDAKDVKADAAAQAKGDKAKAKASKAQHQHQHQHQHQKKKVKPDDAVVLYEKLIQNTAELAELVPNDKPLLAALQARAAAYKAHRCLYLADAYRAIAKWTEAHALYTRTQQLAAAALPLLQSALDKPSAAAETAQLQDVQRLAGAAQAVVHATGVLEALDRAKAAKAAANAGLDAASASAAAAAAAAAEQKGKKKGSAAPLVERLDAFDAGDEASHHSLVSFPPNFQAVPCKPTLFDLAFNGISYPNIDARLKAKPAAPAPAAAAAAAAAKPAPAPATKSFLGRLFGR